MTDSINKLNQPVDPPTSENASASRGPHFPNALPLPFSSFNNKYSRGACYVVGRGRTTFDYARLADINDPIFFINDAVCMEKYARSETFFFAHDVHLRVWLDGSIKATAVLPTDGTILGDAPGVVLKHAGRIVYYRRGEKNRDALLRMSRDELAHSEELFVHTGTIHSLIHFIWYCGFRRATFVGCDGINPGHVFSNAPGQPIYDPRLENRSNGAAGWNYGTIRRAQDLMLTLFAIDAVYIGTPE
jgi:hypothetical protein